MRRDGTDEGTWHMWPYFLGGVSTPVAGAVLENWMRPAPARALGFFLVWFAAGLVLAGRPPTPKWSLVRWTLFGAAGALGAGFVVYLLK